MLDVRGTFSKYREHLTRLTPNPEDALGSPIRGSSELSLAQYWCPRARTGHVPLPSDQVIKVIRVMTPGRSFIPDEHMVWCPEQLLQGVLAHIHYIPDHWQGNAHKSETREEMAQLFQYKAVSGGEQGLVWRQGSLHPGNALSRRGEGREGESTKQLLGTRGMAHRVPGALGSRPSSEAWEAFLARGTCSVASRQHLLICHPTNIVHSEQLLLGALPPFPLPCFGAAPFICSGVACGSVGGGARPAELMVSCGLRSSFWRSS